MQGFARKGCQPYVLLTQDEGVLETRTYANGLTGFRASRPAIPEVTGFGEWAEYPGQASPAPERFVTEYNQPISGGDFPVVSQGGGLGLAGESPYCDLTLTDGSE